MGSAKDLLADLEIMHRLAIRALSQARAVEACPHHRDVYIDCGDRERLTNAYKIGASMVKHGEVPGDQREFTDIIKKVYAESAMDCGYCAKAEAE